MDIRVERFEDENYLPHGMEFEIAELIKLDDHLYKFYIDHPNRKYIEIHQCCMREVDGIGHIAVIEMIEGDSCSSTQNDYIKEKVKGGSILIHKSGFYKTVQPYFKFVPIGWSTMVFVILDEMEKKK